MPLVEAYLVIEQPRQRFGHWSDALAALDSPNAPPLAAVTAHYDPTTDQALLGLSYDDLALGDERLSFVVEVALLAEIGLVQPHELSEGERKRFVTERLARCTIHIAGKRTAAQALAGLVRKLKEIRLGHGSVSKPEPLPVRPPVPPPPPPKSAKPPKPPAPRHDYSADVPTRQAPAPVLIFPQPVSRPPNVPATGTRNDLMKVPSSEAQTVAGKHVVTRQPKGPEGIRRSGSPQIETEPYMPTATTPAAPTMIYARYLRSGRWVPIRIGTLSLKGGTLLAGALPRVQDHVDVALSFANHRALVRGTVGKVSTVVEASASGAATFQVAFELDDASRRQLTALLTAARAAKVTIKPPPPRSTRRFPVEWPICLGTMRGAVRGDALDVSLGGMFVKPSTPLTLNQTLNFSAVLDDGSAPIAGRARVVRQITESEARVCGLAPGFGLNIVEMGDVDVERWQRFLTRVEKRADKRILIGASPARLAELQSHLAAAGYAVTGGTDPGALVQLASTDSRPVDAALIDADWLGQGASATWVETLFSARNVPCVTLHGDTRRARATIDKLLAVAQSPQA